ncbi:MAG: PaaI family thioesterase [Methanomicrobiales archaeon]|nr:PaaI family thioesterase [Methanomicrobiales archaeon]MDI6875346.1 PaaI family thioesterase [Methanomicrobiales archaeon]
MEPSEPAKDSYLELIRRRGRDANPFFRLMGIEISRIGSGEAELTMRIRPDMANGAGWLQGGIYLSLTDEAMALALYSVLGPGEGVATISESTSFIRGAREGGLIARGRVVRRGRRVAFAEGEVRREGGDAELLARTTASFAILQEPERG